MVFLCSGLLKGHGHDNGIVYKEQILIFEIHFQHNLFAYSVNSVKYLIEVRLLKKNVLKKYFKPEFIYSRYHVPICTVVQKQI